MLKDLEKHASRVISRAGRWEAVIEKLEQLDAADEGEVLDLAPTVFEIRALTREDFARATVYPPEVFRSDDGALSSDMTALAYLSQKADEVRSADLGLEPSVDSRYVLREIAAATSALLREDGDLNA